MTTATKDAKNIFWYRDGWGVVHDFVDLEMLRSDGDYQPRIDLKRARRIADSIDWDLIGLIVINKRAGDKLYHVVDGQHRVAGLRMAGEEMAPCEIHEGLTPAEEALLFVRLQTTRRSTLLTTDMYRAMRAAKNPYLLKFEEVVESCGLSVTLSSSGPNTVKGTKGLVDFTEMYGESRMRTALKALNEAWPENDTAHNTRMIQGAVVYTVCFPDNVPTVASRWRHSDPKKIEFNAKSIKEREGGLSHFVFAKALADANNMHAKKRKVDPARINLVTIRERDKS